MVWRKIRAIDLVLHVLCILAPNPGCQEMFSHVLSSGDNCFPPHLMNQAGDYICLYILCPFAVYYLRYAVTSFFTMSRIYLADGKRAG